MSVGSQIKQRRTELNMSQEVLAKKIGVSRSAISNWEIERNYPDLQVIVKLSDVLEIPLDTLLKGNQVMVEKISTDTIQRKKLSKKLKYTYIFLSTLIILVIGALYKTNWLDISSPRQIQSVQYDGDDALFIKVNLPIYRCLGAYLLDYSVDKETVNITLMSHRNFLMTNTEEQTLSEFLYPCTKQVAIVYKNKPVAIYNLDDIDISKK